MDVLLEVLRQTGLAGVATLSIWFAVRKDRQVTRLYDRLEAKTDKYIEKYTALSVELNETIDALTDALGTDGEEDD